MSEVALGQSTVRPFIDVYFDLLMLTLMLVVIRFEFTGEEISAKCPCRPPTRGDHDIPCIALAATITFCCGKPASLY